MYASSAFDPRTCVDTSALLFIMKPDQPAQLIQILQKARYYTSVCIHKVGPVENFVFRRFSEWRH
jgi:hypothetical protein